MLRKNRNLSLLAAVLIGVLLLLLGLRAHSGSAESPAGQWLIAGQNLSSTSSQPAENKINLANVNDLNRCSQLVVMFPLLLLWLLTQFISPIWGGKVFVVTKQTGDLICSHKISAYDGVVGAISRVRADGGDLATSITGRLAPNPPGRFLFNQKNKMEVRS